MLFAKYISLVVLTAVKFLAAALIMLADKTTGIVEMIAILSIGGVIGTLVFFYLGNLINRVINFFINKWKKKHTPKKIFTLSNRRFMKIKSTYGLLGISILTPVILSIPLGCFLATRFYGTTTAILLKMLFGVLGWLIVFTAIKLMLLN